jgi:type IV secretion system protein VirB4
MPTPSRKPLPSSDGHLSEHLPWLCQVTPELILNKDGSIMSAYELIGVDVEEEGGQDLPRALLEMQDALQKLDERYYVWVVTDKRKKTEADPFPGMQSNFLSDLISQRDAARYSDGQVFSLKTYVFILFTGDTGVYRFMDNVRQRMTDDGASMMAAIAYALNPANTTKSAALYDARQLDVNIDQAKIGFNAFVSAHSALRFKPILGTDLANVLYRCANPTLNIEAGIDLRTGTLLDTALSASDVRFGREVVAFHGPDCTKYNYTVSLNGYPGNVQTLANIVSMPIEFRVVHVLHCLSLDKSRQAVQENANYYEMSQSTLRQRVAAYLTNQPAEVDPGMHDLYAQCLDAMRRNNAENLGFIYHSCSLSFFSSTADGARTLGDNVLRSLGRLPVVRERLGLKAAVLSGIPGQWAHNQRLMLANAELVSNMMPITSLRPGSPVSPNMSEVYGTTMPALATFTSRYGTEVHMDPFVGQVGHALVVIPTGGGKTTYVNYCLGKFSRFPDAQVIIFDRDHSCRIVTGLAGGEHLDMREGLQLNPLAHIRESDLEVVWATDFIVRRVEEAGERLTAEQRQEIYQRISAIAKSENIELSLNTLHSLLSRDIQIKLNEWVDGGPFSFFGGPSDQLELSSWTCIEMKEIMKSERLSRAFLDHAFTSIARKLDGRPTFIYVEEASFALKNPSFLAGITEWLQTFRKKNAFVWLTVQSPESISGINSEVLKATIADNIPNLILGANPRLEQHRGVYKDMFGMSNDQIDMIGTLMPKRDYLRVTGNICRTLRTNFDHHILAAIRSEPRFQKLYDELSSARRSDWRSAYINHAIERS